MNNLRTITYSQGKKLYENGKYQFSSPEFKNTLGWLARTILEGIAPEDTLAYAWGDAGKLFGMGKMAFLSAIQHEDHSGHWLYFPGRFP